MPNGDRSRVEALRHLPIRPEEKGFGGPRHRTATTAAELAAVRRPRHRRLAGQSSRSRARLGPAAQHRHDGAVLPGPRRRPVPARQDDDGTAGRRGPARRRGDRGHRRHRRAAAGVPCARTRSRPCRQPGRRRGRRHLARAHAGGRRAPRGQLLRRQRRGSGPARPARGGRPGASTRRGWASWSSSATPTGARAPAPSIRPQQVAEAVAAAQRAGARRGGRLRGLHRPADACSDGAGGARVLPRPRRPRASAPRPRPAARASDGQRRRVGVLRRRGRCPRGRARLAAGPAQRVLRDARPRSVPRHLAVRAVATTATRCGRRCRSSRRCCRGPKTARWSSERAGGTPRPTARCRWCSPPGAATVTSTSVASRPCGSSTSTSWPRRQPDGCELEPGDEVELGISHPCTTFDKWRWIPVVDDEDRIVDVLRTFF